MLRRNRAWQPAFDTSEASLASLAKKYGSVPVITNGHLEDLEKARENIENEEADVVTLAKGALANHDWVNKVKNGEPVAEFKAKEKEVLEPNAKIKEFEV